MPAYYRSNLQGFLQSDREAVIGDLSRAHAADGYYQLLGTQTKSWAQSLPLIQQSLREVLEREPDAARWGVLLEYPLYRLRRRIDLVIIARDLLCIVEIKAGAEEVEAADRRQVEEYAWDLRDFHKASHDLGMQPMLCCTELDDAPNAAFDRGRQVQEVCAVSPRTLADQVVSRYRSSTAPGKQQLDVAAWDASSYEPVPTIIEAATTIFAGHSVREISRADADNLGVCSDEVLRLVDEARRSKLKRIVIVTGVPGAGKTLAGLQAVHRSKEHNGEVDGKVVYLSGNTPLVVVIREALARDEKRRADRDGEKKTLTAIRHDLQTRIQHINDFLKEYCRHDMARPPHEHAIVFDEAQRAWDQKQGKDKFGRDASEPQLLMEIMDRHDDWAAIVCLVGAGQEINRGEAGICQWGEVVQPGSHWQVVAPRAAIHGGPGMAGTALFPHGMPDGVTVMENENLTLTVPIRSYRSEKVSAWVDAVLEGKPGEARRISRDIERYPITLVRSIDECRAWLKKKTVGLRRCGLLASASASRLRAEGLGVSLSAQDKSNICHWYLKPEGDYRSSNALEVTSNEYTSQGLELDYAGVCWGGDFTRSADGANWQHRLLRGTRWQNIRKEETKRLIRNKYRVFLTRAREGLVIFVPRGDLANGTRIPDAYESVASYLLACGAERVGGG